MVKYTLTVIKTGNSYALRVPKDLIVDAQLKLGDKVDISLPAKPKIQDHKKIQQLWKDLQALKPFQGIEDLVAWQRQIRKDRNLPALKESELSK